MVFTFNLLHENWLPLRRRSGRIERVRPASIVANHCGDPFVSPAWGRADFDAATLEFLIGLLATAFAPAGDGAWADAYTTPPSVGDLDAAFQRHAAAFELLGPAARFGQDIDPLTGQEETPVSALLIESPGENAIKKNTDLFQKRGQMPALSRAAAAMALFTLQTYAPAGGAGHRTSMRGGGPLTALLLPPESAGEPATLWRQCWLNTPLANRKLPPAEAVPRLVFPWLAGTITSEGKPPRTVTPDNSHPLQAFWGLPRRIRLIETPNTDGIPCAMTGLVDEVIVTAYRTKPYGVSYEGFEHPLSPHYKAKASDIQFLPVHPRPGGLSYQDWPDLVTSAEATRIPSAVVAKGINRLQLLDLARSDQRPRLSATGYDMDKMKVRGFLEVSMPVFLVPERHRSGFEHIVAALVDAAGRAASMNISAIRQALAGEHADAQASRFAALRETFFQTTEPAFYAMLGALEQHVTSCEGECDFASLHAAFGKEWLAQLRKTALLMFDEEAPVESMPDRVIERTMEARGILGATLAGFGKSGLALFRALGLPLPEKSGKIKTSNKRSEA